MNYLDPENFSAEEWLEFKNDATAYQIYTHCYGIGYKGGHIAFRKKQFKPLMAQLQKIRDLPETA